MKTILSFLIFIGSWLGCYAQERLQVVTKTNRQSVLPAGKPLLIKTNKADVKIGTASNGEITVTWRIMAKNADKAIAEKEINFIEYGLKKGNQAVVLDYRVNLPSGYKKFLSLIVIEVEILVPPTTPVQIETQLATINANALRNKLNANVKFGYLNLNQYGGTANILSSFADVYCENCTGILTATLEKAVFKAIHLGGKNVIRSKFGRVIIQPGNTAQIKVEAFRSPVEISCLKPEDFQWLLETTDAELNVPSYLKKYAGQYLTKKRFEFQDSETGRIEVRGNLSNISLLNQQISITKNK